MGIWAEALKMRARRPRLPMRTVPRDRHTYDTGRELLNGAQAMVFPPKMSAD